MLKDWSEILSTPTDPPSILNELDNPYRIHDEIIWEVQRVQKDPPKLTDKDFFEIIL